MTISVPKVQRVGRPMLLGVVDEQEIENIHNTLNELRTILVALRMDIQPIASGDLTTNLQFVELVQQFNSFKQTYGIAVKDMEFSLNPGFSELVRELTLADNKVEDALAQLHTVLDRQNAFDERLKVVERLLGVELP